jgi:hypothetical protein
MTTHGEVGPHHYSMCPTCGNPVAFSGNGEGDFTGGSIERPPGHPVKMECRRCGPFEARAGDLLEA